VLSEFLAGDLALGETVQASAVMPQHLTAIAELSEVIVIGFKTTRFFKTPEKQLEPNAIELDQGREVIQPTQWNLAGRLNAEQVPPGFPFRDFAECKRLRMNIEPGPAAILVRDRDAAAATLAVQHADLPIVHERMAFNKLDEVRLDVRADHAVRLDHGTGFGINVIPGTAHLRLKPALQRTEEIGQALAIGVGAPDAFELRQKLVRQIGAASELGGAGIPAGPFDDDFMHVWSHNVLISC